MGASCHVVQQSLGFGADTLGDLPKATLPFFLTSKTPILSKWPLVVRSGLSDVTCHPILNHEKYEKISSGKAFLALKMRHEKKNVPLCASEHWHVKMWASVCNHSVIMRATNQPIRLTEKKMERTHLDNLWSQRISQLRSQPTFRSRVMQGKSFQASCYAKLKRL